MANSSSIANGTELHQILSSVTEYILRPCWLLWRTLLLRKNAIARISGLTTIDVSGDHQFLISQHSPEYILENYVSSKIRASRLNISRRR